MRSAAVYRRGRQILISAKAKTTEDAWIDIPPVFKLSCDDPPDKIGETLLSAISHSCTGIPHPTDWKSVERPFLEIAGVKSTSQFMKGAVYCSVDEKDGILRFRPTENRGMREGFVFTKDADIITIPADSPVEVIGETLLKCLDKCE